MIFDIYIYTTCINMYNVDILSVYVKMMTWYMWRLYTYIMYGYAEILIHSRQGAEHIVPVVPTTAMPLGVSNMAGKSPKEWKLTSYVYIYTHMGNIWEMFHCQVWLPIYIYTYVKKTTVVIRWYGISTYIYVVLIRSNYWVMNWMNPCIMYCRCNGHVPNFGVLQGPWVS